MRKTLGIILAILTLPLLAWTVSSAWEAWRVGHSGFLWSLLLATGSLISYGIWQRFFHKPTWFIGSDKQYLALVETSPDNIIIHRHNRILFANQNTLDFFGIENIKPFQKTSLFNFVKPQFVDLVAQRQNQVLNTHQPSELTEIEVNMLDDSARQVSISSTAIDFKGETAMLTFFRDISDQVAIREELMASRERLQLALDAAQDGVWDWDITEGRMVYSKTWANMLGYDLDELQTDKSTWLFLIHPEDHANANALLEAHLHGGSPQYEAEVRLRHKSGHYIWVLDRGQVVSRDEQGRPQRMTGSQRNVTARKEAEQALEIRNRIAEIFLIGQDPKKYQLLLETVIKGTESSCGFLGTIDEDQSLRIWSVFPATSTDENLQQTLRIPSKEIPGFLDPVTRDHGSIIIDSPHMMAPLDIEFQTSLVVPITSQENIIGIFMLGNKAQGFFDSDRSLVESLASYMAPILQSHLTSEIREIQLRQAQKMEALGALAGGIAHDFNNILQAIMGFSALAKDEAPAGGTMEHDLKKVLKAARRGQDLVQRILLFSRREEQEQHSVDINTIARDAVDLLTPTIPSTIEVRSLFANDCGRIMADPTQINQIIMNLATNAFHAMERDGGVMEIGLDLLKKGDRDVEIPESLKEKDVVMLWVKDTGCGISPAEMDRVFDPFYTTKEVGRGTGLGLSVVHGIVVNHGGEVQINSLQGKGTTVTIILPRLPVKEERAMSATSTSGANLPSARIMFVDDEEDITAIGRAMLEKIGYKVTTMSDSSSALSEIQKRPNDFDLVITDLTMPRLTGLQLAEEITMVRPDLPVVLITGMGDGMKQKMKDHPHIKGIIHKPFGLEALQQTIIDVMNYNTDGEH